MSSYISVITIIKRPPKSESLAENLQSKTTEVRGQVRHKIQILHLQQECQQSEGGNSWVRSRARYQRTKVSSQSGEIKIGL